MSEDPVPNQSENEHPEPSAEGGRRKQKIRIKYRQRVKIKKRPKGYKLKRFWEKNRKNIIAGIIVMGLLGATSVMVTQVIKQQMELRKHEKNQRQRMK